MANEDLSAQIKAATDEQLLAMLAEAETQFEQASFRIGEIMLELRRRGIKLIQCAETLKELTGRNLKPAALSQHRTTAEAYPAEKRNPALTWFDHNLARMSENTIAKERKQPHDYQRMLNFAAGLETIPRSPAALASLFRKAHPFRHELPAITISTGMNRVILGDAVQETTTIANQIESGELPRLDLVVTSIPYPHPSLYEKYGEAIKWNGYEDWLDQHAQIAKNLFRSLNDNRVVAINFDEVNVHQDELTAGDHLRRPLSYDLERIYYDAGFRFRDRFIWVKQNCVGNHDMTGGIKSPRINNSFEHIIIFGKGAEVGVEPETVSINGATRRAWLFGGVWSCQPAQRNDAPCPYPFPEEIPYRLIQLYTSPGQIVLDPFLGNGTTAIVAKKLGRQFLGIELDESTAEFAQHSIDNVNAGDAVIRAVETIKGIPVDPDLPSG